MKANSVLTRAAAAALGLAAFLATGIPPSAAHAGKGWQQASPPSHAVQVATGTVTGVADGDTCYVIIDGRSTRVRLAAIDAPEKAQAFGRRSEQSLRQLVWKRTVTLEWHRLDRYGRPIADVTIEGLDVNAEQVRRGMAWVYLQYSQDAKLIALEREARAGKLGLWEQPDPVAPWQWRQANRVPHPQVEAVGFE